MHRSINKCLAVAAIAGAVILFVGTCLHPMDADPNQALAAFTEYAESQHWLMSHLMQLLGVALMAAALVLLSRKMINGRGKNAALLGAVGAAASLALAGALQAVDGIALKAMINTWSAASGADKAILFHAAYAVRQIEIGLASISCLAMGCTVTMYGIALLLDRRFPKWLGTLALIGGIPTAVAGVVMADTGFSETAMMINMPANSILLVWMIALGAHVWKKPVL